MQRQMLGKGLEAPMGSRHAPRSEYAQSPIQPGSLVVPETQRWAPRHIVMFLVRII